MKKKRLLLQQVQMKETIKLIAPLLTQLFPALVWQIGTVGLLKKRTIPNNNPKSNYLVNNQNQFVVSNGWLQKYHFCCIRKAGALRDRPLGVNHLY